MFQYNVEENVNDFIQSHLTKAETLIRVPLLARVSESKQSKKKKDRVDDTGSLQNVRVVLDSEL